MTANPTLHLFCGKIAAGKSTLARRLADAPATILISEDDWLARLYPGEILSPEDYVRCSGSLREAIEPHVGALLRAVLSVALDFPANTIDLRRWMRRTFEGAAVAHQLHYLDVPDAVCKARLRRRNEAGSHKFAASEADFDLFTSYFVPPLPDEGFNVTVYADQ